MYVSLALRSCKMFHVCLHFPTSDFCHPLEEEQKNKIISIPKKLYGKSNFNYFPEMRWGEVEISANLTSLVVCLFLTIQYVHFILHFNCCWQFSQSSETLLFQMYEQFFHVGRWRGRVCLNNCEQHRLRISENRKKRAKWVLV